MNGERNLKRLHVINYDYKKPAKSRRCKSLFITNDLLNINELRRLFPENTVQ